MSKKKYNLNELAKRVAQLETGKKEVSIAQIKEIIKILSIEMVRDFSLSGRLMEHGMKKQNELAKAGKNYA